jgi:Flp pilus assembly protein TadD
VAEAIGHLEQAIPLKPDCAEAHNNLGVILLQQGKVAEAIGHLQQALHCKPDYDDAHYNLGCAFFQQGDVPEAIEHLEQALRLRPRDFELKNKLAWVLATGGDAKLRDGKRAVELAEEADKAAGGKDPAVLDTMAAAYAEVGRFGDGARAAQAAIGLLQANGRAEQARMVQKRLMLYQAGQPYHERSPAAP